MSVQNFNFLTLKIINYIFCFQIVNLIIVILFIDHMLKLNWSFVWYYPYIFDHWGQNWWLVCFFVCINWRVVFVFPFFHGYLLANLWTINFCSIIGFVLIVLSRWCFCFYRTKEWRCVLPANDNTSFAMNSLEASTGES